MDITSYKWRSEYDLNAYLCIHSGHSVCLRVKYPVCVPQYEIFVMICRNNFETKYNILRII